MKKKSISLALSTALGTAFIAGAALSPAVHAADNPFGMQKLDGGYQLAQAKTDDKKKDGKCGEGKCGAEKKTVEKKKDGKCGEGKCGADKAAGTKPEAKMKDGSCGGATKMKDGSCGSKS